MKNTLELLQSQRTELVSQLRLNDKAKLKSTLSQIKELDIEIKELNTIEKLSQVNTKYTRVREIAKLAWDCETPNEDITCNDGSLHKVKSKKYPKICALKYASLKYKDGLLFEIRIERETFQMVQVTYESNKPNVYSRPVSFEAFLCLNNIPLKEITLTEFKAIRNNLEVYNAELEEALKEYSEKTKSINVYSLESWGLTQRYNKTLYQHSFKF